MSAYQGDAEASQGYDQRYHDDASNPPHCFPLLFQAVSTGS